jgi:hypothetical protein
MIFFKKLAEIPAQGESWRGMLVEYTLAGIFPRINRLSKRSKGCFS